MRIVIAAGGTGGHIYPALAMARAFQKIRPDVEIHFVGTPHGLEAKIIPREKFPIHFIPIGRLNHNVPLTERLLTVARLPLAVLQGFLLIKKLKPNLTLGVGGHASGPILLASALMGVRTAIWEPNAIPGLTNRWLSRFVHESLVVFDEANRHLRTRESLRVGMPVREEIEGAAKTYKADPARPLHVLIFGGSQGARPINNIVSQALSEPGDWCEGVEFVHQTGPLDYARINDVYKSTSAKVQVFEYLHDMDQRYLWADLAVCRSGTGTISELAASGKAAVFIPLPHAADNHQQKNAEALVKSQAARMVLQKDFTPQAFKDLVKEFRDNRTSLEVYSENIKSFHQPQASVKIAEHLLKEIES